MIEAIIGFLGVLIGLFAQPVQLHLSNKLNKKDKINQERLSKLIEAYNLIIEIEEYLITIAANIQCYIKAVKNSQNFQANISELRNNPLKKLLVILDFYLNAPQIFLDETEEIRRLTILSLSILAEDDVSSNLNELEMKALDNYKKADERWIKLESEIKEWIKNEKIKLEK